ncbi:uncharacterized protein TNCV_5020121 [Trichonephila clavipes]|nr:uncharacterized protein TNCV_5020121 [Trichonephila clavipes]
MQVHIGVIKVYVVNMKDPSDFHMGNPDMTFDSSHIGTGIILYQIQYSLLVVWCSYSFLALLWVHDKRSTVGQSLVQACKEGVAGNLPPGNVKRTTDVRLVRCNRWFRMPDAHQQAQRACSDPSYYHFVGKRNEALLRARQKKSVVFMHSHLMLRFK